MYTDLSGKYLRAIIKYGNISKAAKSLFISQPYLSNFIINLEEKAGVKLINRDISPIILTYAGERYLKHMDEIKEIYNNLKLEMELISNMKKGRLKLGIDPLLGSHVLYKILPNFINAYSGVEIELTEKSEKEVDALLIERKVDISIRMLPQILNSSLAYERLFKQKLILVIPPGHEYLVETKERGHTQRFNNIRTLNGENFILLEQSRGLRRITDEIFISHSIKPNIVLETSNAESAFQLANSGIGLTIVPEEIIKNKLDAKSMYYTIGNPAYTFNVVVTYNKDKILSPSANAFLNIAKKVYNQH